MVLCLHWVSRKRLRFGYGITSVIVVPQTPLSPLVLPLIDRPSTVHNNNNNIKFPSATDTTAANVSAGAAQGSIYLWAHKNSLLKNFLDILFRRVRFLYDSNRRFDYSAGVG